MACTIIAVIKEMKKKAAIVFLNNFIDILFVNVTSIFAQMPRNMRKNKKA